MPDEIQPALTPEEWREVARVGAINVDSAFDGIHGRELHEQNRAAFYLMALANAALPDDDPRKITREDVRQLHRDAFSLEAEYGDDAAPELRAIAAKLAALLPPDE